MTEETKQLRLVVDDVDEAPEGAILFKDAPPPVQFGYLMSAHFEKLPTPTQTRLLKWSVLTLASLFRAFDETVAGVFEQLHTKGLIQRRGLVLPSGIIDPTKG